MENIAHQKHKNMNINILSVGISETNCGRIPAPVRECTYNETKLTYQNIDDLAIHKSKFHINC